MFSQDIPSWPVFDESELNELAEVIKSGHWAGSRCQAIPQAQKSFLEMQCAKFGFPMSNGTITLEVALSALDIQPCDEIIVPSITFYSTASAVLTKKAIPVIVDVDPSTFCISPSTIETSISSRTKAIIAVHLAGALCNLDEITSIAKHYDLAVIEDCAHAHGSMYQNRGAGTYGKFGSFSFQHSKLVTCGEGGFLVASTSDLRDKAWQIANCGRPIGSSGYAHELIGTNGRMSGFQAAILNSQLRKYSKEFELRKENAKVVSDLFAEYDGITLQSSSEGTTDRAYYNLIFKLDTNKFKLRARDALFEHLSVIGVPTALPYPPLESLTVFKENVEKFRIPKQCDNAGEIFKSTIWLHHSVLLSDKSTLINIVKNIILFLEDFRLS